jgi:predicted DNA-binding protein (UPF0251 family)
MEDTLYIGKGTFPAVPKHYTKKIKMENKMNKNMNETNVENIDELALGDKRLLPEHTAAKILGVSYQTLKRTLRGRVPYYKIGGRILYRVGELETFLKGCRVEK